MCYGLCQEACASWIGTPEQTTSVSRCVGVSECVCVSVSLCGALLLWSCSHWYPSPGTVQRYLPTWVVGTTTTKLLSRSTLEVRAILVPGPHPCLARLHAC